ncbi:hypothetical protein ABT090_20785 [Streptomyces asoensis]|uniref:hypothetical protein n=1 Tax=Streptomyces asoensis TaxID=249586 RepID=UPI00331F5090
MTAADIDADAEVLAEIGRLNDRITELRQQIRAARETKHALTTARNFADSDAAGYIDRTGLEGP